MQRLAALAVACVFLALPPAVSARSFSHRALSDASLGRSRGELVAQARYSRGVLAALSAPQRHWQLASRHRSCWSHVPWSRRCDAARRLLIRHRALYRLARARLATLRPVVGHIAGWSCITYGAHPGVPGDPHEGHGVDPSGTYFGPLQMTRTWSGYTMPWEAMSDVAVYAIAEKVAASHGFEPGWMRGQWPRTYPPCARYF